MKTGQWRVIVLLLLLLGLEIIRSPSVQQFFRNLLPSTNPNLTTSTTPSSLQQGINPSDTTGVTGGVKNINPTITLPGGRKVVCPVGTAYDSASGKCVNIYQGNR